DKSPLRPRADQSSPVRVLRAASAPWKRAWLATARLVLAPGSFGQVATGHYVFVIDDLLSGHSRSMKSSELTPSTRFALSMTLAIAVLVLLGPRALVLCGTNS